MKHLPDGTRYLIEPAAGGGVSVAFATTMPAEVALALAQHADSYAASSGPEHEAAFRAIAAELRAAAERSRNQ